MILSKRLHVRDGDWYEHGLQRIKVTLLREKITLPCILNLFHKIVFFLEIMVNGF